MISGKEKPQTLRSRASRARAITNKHSFLFCLNKSEKLFLDFSHDFITICEYLGTKHYLAI
jgi:hypothetical protein